jgi:sulfate transport system ATP-binding protein
VFGLAGFEQSYPFELSGGMRQRVALLRTVVQDRAVLLLDEPFGALDARVRAELREWLTRLHDVVHVTTVFVTHDQEEAMEVADQIAVMNKGGLEQVGTPRELYDHPANDFVMRFVGDANEVGGVLVRPHDIELLPESSNGASEAMIVRFTMLGRDARVELHDTNGAELVAILTRDRFEELELWRGQTVWVRPKRDRILAET